MKTTSILAKAVILSLVFLNLSCSKDSSDSNNSNPVNTSATTFKLDGVLITADETEATVYNNTVAGGQYIDVYAYKAGVQVLELHMPATVGNYPAQHAGFTMADSWLTYQDGSGANLLDYYHSDSGTMNLTTCDLTADELRGTFNFVGNNTAASKNITEGNLVVTEITHQP
ncbi:hypothetical protein [Flavobacterium sp.]|uniref:hypothetical protein n=1 Tax=Flavobacterium sp. TaxID=239 RepID=UPI0026380E66|nr:hypothetical protein [Flavobacterium sp.]